VCGLGGFTKNGKGTLTWEKKAPIEGEWNYVIEQNRYLVDPTRPLVAHTNHN